MHWWNLKCFLKLCSRCIINEVVLVWYRCDFDKIMASHRNFAKATLRSFNKSTVSPWFCRIHHDTNKHVSSCTIRTLSSSFALVGLGVVDLEMDEMELNTPVAGYYHGVASLHIWVADYTFILIYLGWLASDSKSVVLGYQLNWPIRLINTVEPKVTFD